MILEILGELGRTFSGALNASAFMKDQRNKSKNRNHYEEKQRTAFDGERNELAQMSIQDRVQIRKLRPKTPSDVKTSLHYLTDPDRIGLITGDRLAGRSSLELKYPYTWCQTYKYWSGRLDGSIEDDLSSKGGILSLLPLVLTLLEFSLKVSSFGCKLKLREHHPESYHMVSRLTYLLTQSNYSYRL